LYVHHTDTKTNTVFLSSDSELYSKELIADHLNLIDCDNIESERKVKAKIRYRHLEQPATVVQTDSDTISVVFDEPQRAITKGQSVVLYDGDNVVGGGIIK
jgi:tRNA-specific 2-thiouridylase